MEPDKQKCSNIQDECQPFIIHRPIIHSEPASLTMLDEPTSIRNEQNELYKSRGLKREVRLDYREGGGLMGLILPFNDPVKIKGY